MARRRIASRCASPKRATRNSGARSRRSGRRSLLRFTSADDTSDARRPPAGRNKRREAERIALCERAAQCATLIAPCDPSRARFARLAFVPPIQPEAHAENDQRQAEERVDLRQG